MSDHMTKPLSELAQEILADGIIDAGEVARLRERLYAAGVIDRDEADVLFDLNDATSGKENDPTWDSFFVEALLDHLLKDDMSPGAIDDDEAEWLISRIEGDGVFDANEKALLENLKAQATSVSEKLKEMFS